MQIDTTRMSSRGQIVIPLEMRKDIQEGDKLIVIRKDDEIILKKSIQDSRKFFKWYREVCKKQTSLMISLKILS